MKELLIYLGVSTLCMSLLYLCFRWAMKREKRMWLNRFTLLAIIIASMTIPLLHIDMPADTLERIARIIPPKTETIIAPTDYNAATPDAPKSTQPSRTQTRTENKPTDVPSNGNLNVAPNDMLLLSEQNEANIASSPDLPGYSFWIAAYIIGAAAMAWGVVRGIHLAVKSLRRGRIVQSEGMIVSLSPDDIPVWSLGRYVRMSDSDYVREGSMLLLHEQGHYRLGHIFDLALFAVVQITHWFNPLVWLMKRDLHEIHEYQADDYVLRRGVDTYKYQMLMISKCVGPARFTLATSFNTTKNQLKNRIAMINREKSKKSSLWKTALYLPATAILIIAAATINSKAQAKEPVSIAKNAEWKLPEGWGRAGSDPGAYRMGIDPGVSYEGNRVASIKSIKKPKGFGTLMQTSGVGQYAGKRVRMSGYMKSEGLKYWAGFWLRADKGNESVAFDNMHERAVKGTTAWTKYDIVLDIPADAQQLAFGVLISGEGQVWFSGIKFEVVGKDVAVTNAKKERRAMPEAPINLDFNK